MKPDILTDEQITGHELPDGDYDITGLLQDQRDDILKWVIEQGYSCGAISDKGIDVMKMWNFWQALNQLKEG